jgi:predicted ATPase
MARFVGRDAELSAVDAALTSARAGRGVALLVGGEAGIGKTSLATVALERAVARGFGTTWGRAWEWGGAPTYWPWLQVVRELTAGVEGDALRVLLCSGAAHVAQLVPEVRERCPGLPPLPHLEGAAARFALFDATTQLLRRAGEATPRVLVLDDLHAADEPSLLLLQFVVQALPALPVVVIATYRDTPGEAPAAVASLLHGIARGSQHLRLVGLSRPQIAALVETDDATATALHDASGGNPFFVGELALARSVGGIPASVREVLERRLARLSGESRELLACASSFGREVEAAALRAVCELDDARFHAALEEAHHSGVLVAGQRGSHAFAHALLRETVYEALGAPARWALHLRAARALEARRARGGDASSATLAHHYLAAVPGDPSAAELGISYASKAGDEAMRLSAYEEAVRHYEAGVGAAATHAVAALRCELMLQLASALIAADRRARAREVLVAAREVARTAQRHDQVARAALELARTIDHNVTDAAVTAALEEALETVGREPSAMRARLLAALAMALWPNRALRKRHAQLTADALALAHEVGTPAALAPALLARLQTLMDPVLAEERCALATELVEIAGAGNDPLLEVDARRARLRALLELGDRDAAEADFVATLRLAESVRQPRMLQNAYMREGLRTLLAGEFGEARRWQEKSFAIAQETGDASAEFIRVCNGGLVAMDVGEPSELEPLVPQWRVAMDLWRNYTSVVPAKLMLILAVLGRPEEPRTWLDRASADGFALLDGDGEGLAALCCVAELCAQLGVREHAEVLYARLLPFEHRVALMALAHCMGAGAYFLGLLATALGRFDDAARHLEEAIALHARLRSAPLLAHAEGALARALRGRGAAADLARARTLEAQARQRATQLGMKTLLAQLPALDAAVATAPPADAAAPGTFRREGDQWTIELGGQLAHVRDAKGMRHIARLLERPDGELHVFDIAEPPAESLDAAPVLDARAKAAYRERLTDRRDALAAA